MSLITKNKRWRRLLLNAIVETKDMLLKILKLEDLIKLETAAFVYRFKSQELPIIFDNYFATLHSINDKPTRATSSYNFFYSLLQNSKTTKIH